MIRVRLETIAAAGYSRRASVSDVMRHVRHVGGSLYDVDLAAVMSLDPADEWQPEGLAEYSQRIASAAAQLPRAERAARMGLGDMVAAGLSAVGVTKERVSAAIGRPCRCGDRQAVLNELGAKYLGLPTGTRG